jgi:hypothetical protein
MPSRQEIGISQIASVSRSNPVFCSDRIRFGSFDIRPGDAEADTTDRLQKKTGFRFPHAHLSEKTAVMAEWWLAEDGFTTSALRKQEMEIEQSDTVAGVFLRARCLGLGAIKFRSSYL